MIRHPPSSTLFPSTPLFRSLGDRAAAGGAADVLGQGRAVPDGERACVAERPRDTEVAAAGDGEGSRPSVARQAARSEEHTSELQSLAYLVCRLLLEKKKNT